VLAHTQHLKNKDIYEGGSKLVLALDASELDQPKRMRRATASTNCSTGSLMHFWISL